MRRRTLGALLLVAALAYPAAAARGRTPAEQLMQVVTPPSRAVASAHPHVNVVVQFGATGDGTRADPETFRARLNGRDVTGRFHPILADVETGVRAAFDANELRAVERPRNRLRLSVQAERGRGGKGARARDIDRLRFGVTEQPNQAPVVMLVADAETATPGRPVRFDASGSHDPDQDELAFTWTFSDGGTATGPAVMHVFAGASGGTVDARVEVSDGVTSIPATATLPVAIDTDPGRTPGVLRIEAAEPLELSAVALGGSAVRTLTIRNVDTTATSQLKVRVSTDAADFAVAPATLDLGPDAAATVDVTFTPTASGHAGARVLVLASASNRSAVSLLAHGYGGAAPGDGPTLVGVPVFEIAGGELLRIAPGGERRPLDVTALACRVPGGTATGDACLVDGDCAAGGEVCGGTPFALDLTELCSDDRGLFVLAEDTFTDRRTEPDTELSGTLARFDLDASGTVSGKRILYRTTEETTHLACDGFLAGSGGLVYLAEFRNVVESPSCGRDERDALVTVNKATGNARTASGFSRLDEAVGQAECDIRDGVEQLEVSSDGTKKYAGFDLHGLWRIGPTPLAFTPDVHDRFGVHPDASVAFAIAHDRGATASIDLYRLTEAQVEHGALPVTALAPCGSFTVPNDASASDPTITLVTSMVIAPSTPGGADATALVTFRTRVTRPALDLLPPFGDLRGTVAFSLPARTETCSLLGLVTLRANDLAR